MYILNINIRKETTKNTIMETGELTLDDLIQLAPVSLYVCGSLFVCVSVCVCLFVCLSVYVSLCVSLCVSVCLFMCLYVCLYLCLSLFLSVFFCFCDCLYVGVSVTRCASLFIYLLFLPACVCLSLFLSVCAFVMFYSVKKV